MVRTVTETSQFAAALARCREVNTPSVIEIRIDPNAITPGTTLDALRANALKAKK
jgi:acetolactate synthase I/II/III large subunit